MRRLASRWVALAYISALGVVMAVLIGRVACADAQEKEDRTLLPWSQMRAIVDEASGERAMHHVQELVPYPRIRTKAEISAHMRETEVMANFAREYGYSNVEIETFPASGRDWFASQGELWMVSPDPHKIYDIHDVAISLAPNSETGDVTAEVVDVGVGSKPEDYAGKDVNGKIVLGSASTNVLQRLGVFERGAAGVVSYNVLYPDDQPDISLSQSVSSNAPEGKHIGFGWAVSARTGRELVARLARGEKVTLRSVVKSETVPGRLEVVHAQIPGDGSSDQQIIISGHLFEGYIKQGANDDNSGCAVTLEMGRTIIRLVNEGKLPKPKRTIHFLWVPEISGTNAWLAKHTDIKQKLITNLNFDMEGLGLRKGNSWFVLLRTPDTFPTFLNDATQSIMAFVSDTNRERVRYRAHGYSFSLPVFAPNGSRDSFYTWTSKHYGASDHVVYLNNGIPAIIFSTWPDPWYHSSQDTPDKLDSTQFKRVAVIGAASAILIASADDSAAARIAAESLGRASERLGSAERKGVAYIADAAPEAAALLDAYKEARIAVQHEAVVEKTVVGSAATLYANPHDAEGKLQPLQALIDQNAGVLLDQVKTVYQLKARQASVTPAEPGQTDAEKRAARLLPERVAPAGGGGGGFGAVQAALARLSPEERASVQAALAKVPQHMTAELNVLLGQKRSVLEIRDFLSGEFEPLPLTDLLESLNAQQKLGFVKITEKPEEPAAPAKKDAKPPKKRKP